MAKQQGFPLRSYYGRHMKPKPIRTGLLTPITKKEDNKKQKNGSAQARKPLDDFEAEYQAFIAQLRAKKEAEEKEG